MGFEDATEVARRLKNVLRWNFEKGYKQLNKEIEGR